MVLAQVQTKNKLLVFKMFERLSETKINNN